jgi:hypothetical protein
VAVRNLGRPRAPLAAFCRLDLSSEFPHHTGSGDVRILGRSLSAR